MDPQRTAMILGAGPTGLITALRLKETTSIVPIIYEIRAEPTTLGGAVGIPANGLRLLDRLGHGVYEALLQRGSSRSDFGAYSLASSGSKSPFASASGSLGGVDDFVSDAREKTGYGYMRIKRTDLVDVLLDAVHRAGISVCFGKRVATIDESDKGVRLSFEDGSSDTGDILLGCDGIHSSVRQIYVDPDQKPEYSGMAGLFSIVPVSKLDVSEDVLGLLKGLTMTTSKDGIFLVAPCTPSTTKTKTNDNTTTQDDGKGKGEVYWGFQRQTPLPDPNADRDGWEIHGQEEVNSFKSNLHTILSNSNASGPWSSLLRELIGNTEIMKFHPIYRLPLGRTWWRGRCLLLGDAAHAMQPHAGQGVSMGVEDAFLLSRLLSNTDTATDTRESITQTFKTFESIRRPRTEEIYHAAAAKVGMRKKAGPWGQWVKENRLWLSLLFPGWFGLREKMFGQEVVCYDVDEEGI